MASNSPITIIRDSLGRVIKACRDGQAKLAVYTKCDSSGHIIKISRKGEKALPVYHEYEPAEGILPLSSSSSYSRSQSTKSECPDPSSQRKGALKTTQYDTASTVAKEIPSSGVRLSLPNSGQSDPSSHQKSVKTTYQDETGNLHLAA